ncbi:MULTISPECIES: FtsH protease activity modulator HflK [Halobacteriovorax]|uniref:Protein HflK n=1 Tax=Halobacteriovorax vibrionivorans TaxID=2152716 RepID=A0ABY0IIW5_9BACT|nr:MULTISPECIES: FtsH protease activity modulator HflK [Halobacteriovorax]AYF45863.1 HflK protein [Halobacteriovorax sp. BALOs_7]RZF22903.1 FtsH protease activity modulator HflK [Halobacteriovorax vibrionivorans]TGD47304.1 FtsH protease activity modulator HflK [Halobacteriovorax sp. Y22]
MSFNNGQAPRNDFEKMKQDLDKGLKLLGPFFIFVVLFVFGYTSFYTVEPDEEAVVIRLGKYVDTNPPGLHFKIPFGIDNVIKVKVKTVLQEEFGFRTKSTRSRRTSYSSRNLDSESLMLTGDLNVASVEWAVQYQVRDPFKFIFQTSEPVRNIRDISESIMRRVVGDRSVTDVLTVGKVEIEADAKVLMQEVIDKYDMGVTIISVKLQDVNPPQVVKASFNEVNEAKQEQEKAINQAEGAYNKVIPEARGKAEKIVSEAEGYAAALVNRAEGDVAKFKEVLKEYKRAPRITKKRLYIEAMEGLYKNYKNLTIIDPKVKGLLPVFDKGGK